MGQSGEHPIEVVLESKDFSCDDLQIGDVTGVEAISRLFRFEISVTCRDPAGLDPRQVVGANATLIFVDEQVELRRVHGMVCEMTDMLDSETQFYTYRLVLVPRAHRATLVEKQEIFIDMSVPEVISKTLRLLGFPDDDVEMRLAGEYPKREFVVQYKETDLAFISRLAEHLGISFFFEHHEGKDRLIFTDHKNGFRPIEGHERLGFRSRGEHRGVYRLDATTRMIPATYVVSDYDYEKPLVDLASTFEIEGGFGGVVEYGTHFKEAKEGTALARVRAEERLVTAYSSSGQSSACVLFAGGRFTLEDHPRGDDLDLLVYEVEHRLHQAALGAGKASDAGYTNTFRCIQGQMMFRPARITPKPSIRGVTCGVVEAAPGVETHLPYIDNHGRYLVRVLFDTAQPGERKASLPIRMAQAHSGPGYGIHFPLRPGIEVLLAFIDGDPDRPLIIGSVPNAITPTPVNEAERSMHRIRTYSGVLVEIDDESA